MPRNSYPQWIGIALLFIGVAFYLFYIPLFETFNGGQTLGKKIVGIKVVRTDGSPATGVNCMLRFLFMLVDYGLTFGICGVVCTSITKRRQRLGDLAADTMVVLVDGKSRVYDAMAQAYHNDFTEEEKRCYQIAEIPDMSRKDYDPLELADNYRQIECLLVRQRTRKGHKALIDWLETLLGMTHMKLFRHTSYTIREMVTFTLRSIPRAVYESRYYLLASLAVALLSYVVGIYSQTVDHEFFRKIFGSYYASITDENIAAGNPMDIYGRQNEFEMFFEIFFNNLLVTLRMYIMGIFVIIGPMVMLMNNFVSFAVFDTYFAQHGLLGTALLVPNVHGALELSAIIIAGGAAFYLGTGWLFPGRRTRLQAFYRSARHSMLVLLSVLPVLFVAAFIESFITRHTEWGSWILLAIVVLSLMFIIGYYVVLSFIAKRQ